MFRCGVCDQTALGSVRDSQDTDKVFEMHILVCLVSSTVSITAQLALPVPRGVYWEVIWQIQSTRRRLARFCRYFPIYSHEPVYGVMGLRTPEYGYSTYSGVVDHARLILADHVSQRT